MSCHISKINFISVCYNIHMEQYLSVLKKILEEGKKRESRAGDTISLFAEQMRFDLTKGFPAVTTKKLAFKAVVSELIWFLDGGKDTVYRMNNNKLKEILGKDKTIWSGNEEADYWKPKSQSEGDLGRIYGSQWRNWNSKVDQIKEMVEKLKTNPDDRRIIVSAWNPAEIDDMALPPCHTMFQVFHYNGELSLHMYQRSCDMFLGVPFNIASYALLLELIAQVVGMRAKELIITLGDAHIYSGHIEQVKEQITREPYSLPKLVLNSSIKDLEGFSMEDILLEGYEHHPTIYGKMAV